MLFFKRKKKNEEETQTKTIEKTPPGKKETSEKSSDKKGASGQERSHQKESGSQPKSYNRSSRSRSGSRKPSGKPSGPSSDKPKSQSSDKPNGSSSDKPKGSSSDKPANKSFQNRKNAVPAPSGPKANPPAEAAPEKGPLVHQVVEPGDPLPPVDVKDLPPVLREAMKRSGWSKLMEVQAKTIPYFLARRDLMVQSRTGSGKTGAFLMPTLQRIKPERSVCQALILVPTRELAKQVATEAETLCRDTGVRVVALYGGTKYKPQIDALKNGAQLVVGTPGRVLDHLMKSNLNLDDLQLLILDEADRMLSMGFYPDMKKVQTYLPGRRIGAYMFSATFPPHVMSLAGEFLHHPEMLSLSKDHVHVPEIEHVYYQVDAMGKDRTLVKIIEMENPTAAIIFCNTKADVSYVNTVMQRYGYVVDELSSDLSQNAREKVLSRVRTGALRFLVATDVAARGIDIPEISHVILYNQPDDPEIYIHRSGRTGRAGAGGVAISLVDVLEHMTLSKIARKYEFELIERPVPEDSELEDCVAQRIMVMLEARLRSRDNVENKRLGRFLPLAASLASDDDARSLLALLLDDFYQASLHTPPPIPGHERVETQTTSRSSESHNRSRRRRPRNKSGQSGRGGYRGKKS